MDLHCPQVLTTSDGNEIVFCLNLIKPMCKLSTEPMVIADYIMTLSPFYLLKVTQTFCTTLATYWNVKIFFLTA